MKRKIALVLAAVMTTAMLPMNAMAGSTNSISKVINIKTDSILASAGTPVRLELQPRSEVESNESIIISVENGKFNRELVNGATSAEGMSGSTTDPFIFKGLSSFDALKKFVGDENSRQLPYGFRWVNETELEVKLYPIQDSKVNQNNSDVTQGTPIYSIALPITTEDSNEGEDVKITIDDNGSAITGGSADTVDLPDITIKEDVQDTFNKNAIGHKIEIKASGNYEFDTSSTPILSAGVNATFADIYGTYSDNAKKVIFTVTEEMVAGMDDSKLSSIIVKNLAVTTDNENTYGDINVTISGDSATNVTTQTIKVAERKDYGFNLQVLEEVPTMYSGRTFIDGEGDKNSNDYDQDDFTTAEFRFSETTPDTWLTSRKLELTVPEGVKIVGADVTKTKYVKNVDAIRRNLAIANDGQSLRINAIGKDVLNEDEASEVEFELYLTADPTFTGDVTVTAAGAGLDADALSPITVAKFVSPVTIESSVTKANMGYQAIDTADIVIKENEIGALAEGKSVEVKIDSLYGENELGFADDDVKVEVAGETEIKNFKVSNGEIKFNIDVESYANPSTITISNVKVGTTRSIPYGAYDLLVSGDAVVNNYIDDVDVNYPINNVDGQLDPQEIAEYSEYKYSREGFDKFDQNEGFEFKGYLTIVTDTATLDGKVEVTIGESNMKVDGNEIAMDAAAYIQPSSNSTMVPLRFVSVALGVDSANVANADDSSKILWDATAKSATIMYAAGSSQKIVKFTAGSPIMTIDGTDVTMENGVVAEIKDGRMYVPFRALGQALGVPVSWNADTRTAIYNER